MASRPRFYYTRAKRQRHAAGLIGRAWLRRRNKNAYRRYGLYTKVKRIQKKIYQDSDNRWKDSWWTSQSMPSTGLITDIALLGTIIQGDNINERAGNKITLKSLYLSFNFLASDAYNNMRIILFSVPCSQAGTLPTIDQILASVSTVPIALPGVHSPYTKNSTLEFKIIFDKKFTLQRQQAGAVKPTSKWLTIRHKFKKNGGHPVHYETGTATSPVKGNIYLLAVSDSQAPPHPSYTCYSRLNYSG